MYHALIMAGGTGTRLWPLSRSARPKQALKLIGEHTMFQHAVGRIADVFPPERVFVVTREEHVACLAEQVQGFALDNFLVEPEGRGTAPAIGLGAIHLHRRDPNAIMAVLTADHYITAADRFLQTLGAAETLAEDGYLVTLGIQPSSPSTGFGYVKQGESLGEVGGLAAFRVERFTEKPDLETATQMVASGDYSWNSGMFIWRTDRILEEFQRQMPEFYAQLTRVAETLGTPDYLPSLRQVWPQVGKQTIDYGVMEGAEKIAVLPVDLGWSDVGSWGSVLELLPADENGNTVVGPHLALDTRDTLVFGENRLVATLGVEGLIIVDTEDALLICPKEREQEVRALVDLLEAQGRAEWL